MSYKISDQQKETVRMLSSDKRYDYFVSKVIENKMIWSLRSDKGWVMVSAEGQQCLPVWPHPDFAAEWATDDWSDCKPVAIELDVWMKRWLPGMEKDEISVAVFPSEEEQGIVVEPVELLESMEDMQNA